MAEAPHTPSTSNSELARNDYWWKCIFMTETSGTSLSASLGAVASAHLENGPVAVPSCGWGVESLSQYQGLASCLGHCLVFAVAFFRLAALLRRQRPRPTMHVPRDPADALSPHTHNAVGGFFCVPSTAAAQASPGPL